MRYVLFASLLLIGSAGIRAQEVECGLTLQPDVSREARLDVIFTRLAEEERFQGGAMLAQEGAILWQGSYGLANLETEQPITHDTIYELASVGKAFTGMAILTLVHAGELSLDDAVENHLDSFPYADITVRQLLNHTSGLPDYTEHLSPDEVPQGFDGFITNEDILVWLAGGTDGREFEPGSRFNYSNSNYLALALIVESISGMDFGDYLEAVIFEPLEMDRTLSFTTRYTEEAVPPNYAFGYTRTKFGRMLLPEDLPDHEFLSAFSTVQGDGTVAGSLADFALWEAAWTTDVLIPEALRNEAFMPTTLTTGEVSDYGLAWESDSEGGVISHWGGWYGYTTGCYINLETRTVFAFAITAPLNDWDWVEEIEAIIAEDG